MVWYFIGVYIINRTLHGRLEIQNFSSRVEKIFHEWAQRTSEIFFNTRREISYLRAAIWYPLYKKKAHNNPPRPARLWLIEFLVICNNTKENFLWEPEKINVNFHKNTSYTWNFQNFTCVFTILVKFDINFLGLPGWEILFGVITDC